MQTIEQYKNIFIFLFKIKNINNFNACLDTYSLIAIVNIS